MLCVRPRSPLNAAALILVGVFAVWFTVGIAFAGKQPSSETNILSGDPCGTRSKPPVRYKHVVWIVMENKGYSDIIGSPAAPYINTLAKNCGVAE